LERVAGGKDRAPDQDPDATDEDQYDGCSGSQGRPTGNRSDAGQGVQLEEEENWADSCGESEWHGLRKEAAHRDSGLFLAAGTNARRALCVVFGSTLFATFLRRL
jgi:hypothetical protein